MQIEEVRLENTKTGFSRLQVQVPAKECESMVESCLEMMATCCGLPIHSSLSSDLQKRLGKRDYEVCLSDLLARRFTYVAAERARKDIFLEPQPKILAHYSGSTPLLFLVDIAEVPKTLFLSSFEPIKLRQTPPSTSQKDIDSRLSELAGRYSTLETVTEDRSIVEDDIVRVTVSMSARGLTLQRYSKPDVMIDLSNQSMPPEFISRLKKLRKGDVWLGNFTVPKPFAKTDEDLEEIECSIEVLDICRRVYPDITDEWVRQTLPQYSSVKELKASILLHIEETGTIDNKLEVENTIKDILAERIEGELPCSLKEFAMEEYLYNYRETLNRAGVTLAQHVDALGESMTAFFERTELKIINLLKVSIALDLLFDHLQLTLHEEDIDETIEGLFGKSASQFKSALILEGKMRLIEMNAKKNLAFRWLMENAEIV